MSREIKYRGKRLDNGEWVYGFYWRIQNDDTTYDNYILLDTTRHISNVTQTAFRVDPNTVGRYIELKDEKENEIYEDDIVEFEDLGEEGYEYKEGFDFTNYAVITWDNVYTKYTLTNFMESENSDYANDSHNEIDGQFLINTKIIGNIYDNPELLKENKD